jgi:hypothetical protein
MPLIHYQPLVPVCIGKRNYQSHVIFGSIRAYCNRPVLSLSYKGKHNDARTGLCRDTFRQSSYTISQFIKKSNDSIGMINMINQRFIAAIKWYINT